LPSVGLFSFGKKYIKYMQINILRWKSNSGDILDRENIRIDVITLVLTYTIRC